VIRVRFWGTRGGIVSPGPATQRYGGNTACVEVVGFESGLPGAGAHPGNPRLILDGGTGLASAQEALMAGPCGRGQGDLCFLLSHYHWDHLIGLAFGFKPILIRGNHIIFHGASVQALRSSIERLFTSVYSPLPHHLLAFLEYREVVRAGMEVAGFHVRAAENRHPGGALSYRVEYGGHAVVYSTDHECGDRDTDAALIDLARGADVWVLDAMYTEAERPGHRDWGHSSPREAVDLAHRAHVRSVVLFHHSAAHDDDMLDRIGEEATVTAADKGIEVLVARDKMVVDVGGVGAEDR
jgi:phosphoribosyl 1,2-cyclic phosphodiesterase